MGISFRKFPFFLLVDNDNPLIYNGTMLKIGLVLSGGMAKGAYQMGALKAMEEHFEKGEIAALSSASIGVINAFAFANGMVDRGIELWKNLMKGQKRTFITSILKGDYLQESIKKLSGQGKRIDSPFLFPLLYANGRKLKYADLSNEPPEDYQKFLQASVALPMTNKAVELHGEKLYDGALVDNIPVKPLENLDLDLIICFFFEDSDIIFEHEEFDSKIIKIAFTNDTVIRDSISFERERIERMLEQGYAVTKENLDYYFSGGKEDLDSIKEKIRIKNGEKKNRTHRITGDLVVRKFNKIMKHFIKSN